MSTSVGTYGAISVTTTATKILSGNGRGKGGLVQPTNGTIYVGYNSSVTTSTGSPVASGAVFGEDDFNGDVYAIAAGTVDVRYVNTGGAS